MVQLPYRELRNGFFGFFSTCNLRFAPGVPLGPGDRNVICLCATRRQVELFIVAYGYGKKL